MTCMSNPKVSIITPYRDAAVFLPGVIANIKSQVFSDWESLLIDHGSIDHGYDLACRLTAADPRFRHLRVSWLTSDDRRLPAIPRNVGLAHARGDVVTFLDVDDLWHPDKLKRQLDFHQKSQLDISVTAYAKFHQDGLFTFALRVPPESAKIRRELFYHNPIPMLSVMVRRSCLAAGFPLIYHEDYALWLSLFAEKNNLRYGCLPQVLAFYRDHSSNHSNRRPELLRWTYGVFRAAGASRRLACLGVMRWCMWHLCHVLSASCVARSHRLSLSLLLTSEPISLGA